MLSTHIASQIYGNFGFEPTPEQKKIINSLSEYIVSPHQHSLFVINGYAGTGKTYLLGAVVKTFKSIGIKSILMAPTGRAAKVMSQYCQSPAFTIHKKIYRQKKISADSAVFDLNINKDNDTIYIVDEASMLSNSSSELSMFGSGRLIDDMVEYINNGSNNKLIIVGDNAQLPPVGLDGSPALNPDQMRCYGDVNYNTLCEVVRQGEFSGILHNATLVREMIEQGWVDAPCFDLSNKDVERITGAELIEALDDSYRKAGMDQTTVITRSNKRANQYNQGIRRTILDFDEEICSGDMIMVVKNNYFYVEQDKTTDLDFIANGDVAMVRRIYKTRDIYGFRFAYVGLSFPDYNDYEMECWILLDTLHSDAPSLTRDQNARLFTNVEQDYIDIKNKRNRYKKIKENEFFNALQVKFAYAITCHKAQGGQWQSVFLDTMLFGDEPMTREFQRWLYTALTRATEKLYLVNWGDRFFKEDI